MKPLISLRDALADEGLLGTVLAGETWGAWRTVLIAAMGERLTEYERTINEALTGRSQEPVQRVEELVAVVGRRGGKTRAIACLAAYVASCVDYTEDIVPGERGLVLCLAQNMKQAAVAFGYIAAIFDRVPMLAAMIVNRTSDTLVLSNGIAIEIRPASFRGLRGITCVAAIADEAAFWYSDEASANTDSEILSAVRPALATTNGLLVIISSPYARRGEVWNLFKRHYGPGGDPEILVAKGATRDFNPSLPQRTVDRALERDPTVAASEWMGEFRSDIQNLFSIEAVEAAVDLGCFERPRLSGQRYVGFVVRPAVPAAATAWGWLLLTQSVISPCLMSCGRSSRHLCHRPSVPSLAK